jgi:uncharacterized protein (DUF2141 family)
MQTLKATNQLRLLSLLITAVVLYGCATESVPLGGPEDKTPPELKAANPPDKTINFKGNKIQLEFNEFIQSSSGFNQTIISPATKEKPDIKANRKTVTIKLKEELQPNTTYTINFGDDIKDINQGNLLSNFTYVFSTGSYIDSQSISGKAITAEDGNAADGYIVSLYNEDSVTGILNSKPLYFTKTNSLGIYKIQNIKPAKYRVFVLKDQNFNYLYDQPNERIGFANDAIDLTDSVPAQVNLTAFAEKKKKVSLLNVKSTEPGKAIIMYSAPINSLKLSGTLVDSGYKLSEYPTKDTLTVCFSNYYTKEAELFLTANDTLIDTVRLECKFVSKDSALAGKLKPLFIVNQSIKVDKGRDLSPSTVARALYGSLKINLTRPVTEINKSKGIQIIDSATQKALPVEYSLDEKTAQTLELNFERKEKNTYTLIIPDSCFLDIFGFWNNEIRLNFRTNAKEDYGNIHLKLSVADVSKHYVVKLLNPTDEVIKTITVHNSATIEENLTNLPAGNYHITVLEDTNGNGVWDTGSLQFRMQPEKYIPFKDVHTLKGGWDLDVEVKF